jgi:hypothetical protein
MLVLRTFTRKLHNEFAAAELADAIRKALGAEPSAEAAV